MDDQVGGDAVAESTGDAIDGRITRLLALLADRDRQVADRLVVTELAGRLDRALAALDELLARAVAAEDEALAATARAQLAESELTALRARFVDLDGPRLAAMGVKRTARELVRRASRD